MPGDVRLRSDLAAAYYVLAQHQDEPARLVQALDAADEALKIDSSMPAALFNRALILDRLFLVDRARTAWQSFLDLREDSGWSVEAREKMSSLDQPSLPMLWRQDLPELQRLLRQGDARAVRKLVALYPQEARDFALEDLLGSWGDLWAGGRPREATEQLAKVRRLGDALDAETGEPIVRKVVHTIDQAARQDTGLASMAFALRAFRDGQREVRQQLAEIGAPHLREACHWLGHDDNPLAEWALVTLAGIDLTASRYDDALGKYQTALLAARRYGSSALAGRARWGIGLVRLRQGRLAESLPWFLDAVSDFEKGRERENLGGALAMVAENARVLGQFSTAWQYRYQAARNLYPYRSSIRLHNLLWEAGWSAAREGAPRAATDLLDEDVALGQRVGPQRQAEALLWRSKVDLAAEDFSAARLDLQCAVIANQGTPDHSVRQRLAVDLEYVDGEVRRRSDPAAALAPLSAAIDFYSDHQLYLDLPGAYLARFHAERDSGLTARAEEDLEEALQLFERRRDTLADPALRISVAESVQDLYDEMLLLKAARKDAMASLAIAERARALAEPATSSQPLGAALASLPPDRAVIEYARAGDHLFIWLLHDGQVMSEVRDLPPGSLEAIVNNFVAAIAGRFPMTEIEPRAKALYQLLIPSAVASLASDVALVIIPDKILNSLPFAALMDPMTGRYLVEERAIRMAARATSRPSLQGESSTSRRDSVLLVGATDFDLSLFANLGQLPGAAQEVSLLAPVFPDATVLIGAEATQKRLLQEIEGKSTFHFAGHAIFNSQQPGRSYLVLAPAPEQEDRGVLFLQDLTGRHFARLRLVVLSACRTLGPAQTRTSGIAGLARPFLAAGVNAVVGSLWDVDDRAAARLLPSFHRQYRKGGDAAAALRTAQLELIRSGNPILSHPDSWAVFQAVLSN